MGNNGSRTGNISQRQPLEPEQQWAHSFPRTPARVYQHQHKVLPDREVDKKLRATNNGDILHSGGTISGRHQQTLSLEREDKSFRIFRTNSISSNPSDEYQHEEKPQRAYLPHHRGVHRYAAQRYENKNMHKEQMKKFGSVPDLRDPAYLLSHQDDRDKFKGKKKYKAPPPPKSSMLEKSNVNCYQWDEPFNGGHEPLIRRGRLFKTKAEVQKKYSSPIKNSNQSVAHESALDCKAKPEKQSYEAKNVCEQNKLNNLADVEIRDYNRKPEFRYNRLSLPEMYRTNSVPEFQAELKEVIQRIKSTKPEPIETSKHNNFSYKYEKKSNKPEQNAKEKLKTLDHNISKRENIRSRMKQIELETVKEKDNAFDAYDDRGQPSGKESTPEKTTPQVLESDKKDQPSKLFYFGMNEPIHEDVTGTQNYADNTVVDHFAATLQSYNRTFPLPNSSGSDMSSELEMDESQVSSSGIALQLRPILPKKQLEIPRFSPAAAWKLLSAVESNFAPSTAASDDGPIFMEDRIEKLSRPPPPPALQAGPRSSYDKSGDSGISGDAGPAGFDDSPEGIVDVRNNLQLPLVLNRSQGISWTPQQDLGEEESSTDEEIHNHHNRMHRSATPVKFTPKPNVFSLSLPRDNHLSSYISSKNNTQPYVGLQKLKRSVSGVLGNLANKKDSLQSNPFKDQSENWFLSKSAPNSLNNGFNSLEIQNSQKSEEAEQAANLVGAKSNTQNVTRIMYLPELDNLYVKNQNSQRRQERAKNKELYRERSRSAERTKDNFKMALISKSCENISSQVHSSPEPEDLQDPPKQPEDKLKSHKPKRFTFQSTIRQIERRRLAEKLSKEAERKEKQRLSELEAMQRVEEEFQRKRAREKASIRQQLRLFSLDETSWSSLPPNLEIKDDVPPRSEPDGAVSSSTSSPTLPSEKSKRIPEEGSRRKITPASDSSDENVRKAPMTQILSEYRQPQREYKDFRGSPRYRSEYSESHFIKQTTVHPQVTYNMPKASEHQSETEGSSNYRKQFAHGVRTSRSGDSTYSDDSQPNRNYSPKIYRSKKAPISNYRQLSTLIEVYLPILMYDKCLAD